MYSKKTVSNVPYENILSKLVCGHNRQVDCVANRLACWGKPHLLFNAQDSDWLSDTSRVQQASVLERILYHIYQWLRNEAKINHIEICQRYVSKVGGRAFTRTDCGARLFKNTLMKLLNSLRSDKDPSIIISAVMHVGSRINKYTQNTSGRPLQIV